MIPEHTERLKITSHPEYTHHQIGIFIPQEIEDYYHPFKQIFLVPQMIAESCYTPIETGSFVPCKNCFSFKKK